MPYRKQVYVSLYRCTLPPIFARRSVLPEQTKSK